MLRDLPMRSVVTPGNFDGVHRGHQALVARAKARASERSARAVALFFDPHPRAFFARDAAAPLLTTPARRAELLEGRGADHVDVRTFDAAFAALTPEAFAEEVLVRAHRAAAVVVGPDFRFGHRRAGDVELLRRLGRTHGFEVETVDPVEAEGAVVSSTRVRGCLAEGDVAEAAALLGRVHDVAGEVRRGDQRGRTLGFPTANLDLGRGAGSVGGLPPADGVYAVVARRVGPGG
ncbi:MAG: riboflavin kinase, partial [Myxococcota bacterium]